MAKISVISLVGLLSFIACRFGYETVPINCGGENCSGHGNCMPDDKGNPQCECFEGYLQEDNQRCVADPNNNLCNTNADCQDSFDCTTDVCQPHGDCTHAAVDALCGDNTDCTLDSCDPGSGCTHAPIETGVDCGRCLACNDRGQCVDSMDQNADCPPCQQCGPGGACIDQGRGDDLKNDCPAGECLTGSCDGQGGCGFEAPDWPCGSSTSGECDREDGCDGAGNCLPNPVQVGTPCTDPDSTDCGIAQCDGAGNCDPDHAFEDSSKACRPAIGECDLAETCTGSSASCPTDSFQDPGAPCTDLSPGDCQQASCDGAGNCDQAYGFVTPSVVCRSAATECDKAENCTGSSASCPTDSFQDPGAICTDLSPGDCQQASCDGAGNCDQNYSILDADQDGYPPTACGGTDCLDSDNQVNPGATEGPYPDPSCGNGLDDDCDGLTDQEEPACASPDFCTIDNWCWQHPLPQGNTLAAFWSFASDDTWAVGDHGLIMHWNGSIWHQIKTGTDLWIEGVHGCAPDDVWFVGDNRTIFHWDGKALSSQDGGTGIEDLRSVWCQSPTNIWAAGSDNLVLHGNGTDWAVDASAPPALYWSIFGFAANDIWAGTDRGILHYNGVNWSFVPGIDSIFWSIHGNSPTNVWAVGTDFSMVVCIIYRYTGSWAQVSCPISNPVDGVISFADDNAWAAAWGGEVLEWNGSGWSNKPLAQAVHLYGIGGSSSSDIWTGGMEGGSLAHWDGAKWSYLSINNPTRLFQVFGSSSSDVWAVGDGVIFHFDGAAWAIEPSGPFVTFFGVHARTATAAWAVGYNGIALSWNGNVWSPVDAGAGITKLLSVWAFATDNVWIVGEAGTVRHYNGSSWSSSNANTSEILNRLFGLDPTNLWAVGNAGVIRFWNGGGWQIQPSGTGNDLFAVWGFSPTELIATGAAGTLLQYNGSDWLPFSCPSSQDINGVWGTSSSNFWIIDHQGGVFHFEGSAWHQEQSGTYNELNAIWGINESGKISLWVSGLDGTILSNLP